MKKSILLFGVVIFFCAQLFSQQVENYKQVEIQLNQRGDILILNDLGIAIDEAIYTKENSVIAYISDSEFELLKKSNFVYRVLIDNWYNHYNSLPKLSNIEKENFISESKSKYGVSGLGYGSMGGFYTYAEVNAQLDSMKTRFPNLITAKVSIGTSVQSRNLHMVKISDNPDVDENEPEVLYTGLHHAREPQGMTCDLYFMWYLLENYNTNPSVKYLVDNRELYFVPVVNPDGYEYNHQTNPSGGGMWRKNRSLNSGYYGVDLNRNYGPYAYWNAPNGGSSTNPSDDTYRGPSAFSELEIQAIKNFVATRYFKCALNYHTYSNLLIYPYGALSRETKDSLIFREFARDMVAFNGYEYGTDMQTVGYSTRGNSDDFMYDGDTVANHGRIFAMTPEVGSTGFWPTQAEIFPLAQENLGPNLYYAWVAGEYVSMVNAGFNQQYYDRGSTVLLTPTFKNKGLSDASDIIIKLTSVNPNLVVNVAQANLDTIRTRSSKTLLTPLSMNISSSAPIGQEVKFVLSAYKGMVLMSADTISMMIGVPSFFMNDTTNVLTTMWNPTSSSGASIWETTTTTFYSSPNCYTDSKAGSYVSNATITMTLKNSLDITTLSYPKLSFWTKFETESGWDYCQVEASSNNGSTWIPLSGIYTTPGSGSFQPNGEPLYDGSQSAWVREEMNLNNVKSNQFKLKFELKSDGSIVRDGWYVDDIGVFFYTSVPVELESFTAKINNGKTELLWNTATELNNKGFEIQRGLKIRDSEKVIYSTIGFINGNGTSEERHQYTFVDNEPLTGEYYYRLKQIDYSGTYRIYGPVEVNNSEVFTYSLEQNYPNPFNPSTVINYSIPASGKVTIKLFSSLGEELAVLVNENKDAGRYNYQFDGSKYGSGIYFYQIQANDFSLTRKMILIK